MVANFEKFLMPPGFILNSRKIHQIFKSYIKSSERYCEKKTFPLDRIGLTYNKVIGESENCHKTMKVPSPRFLSIVPSTENTFPLALIFFSNSSNELLCSSYHAFQWIRHLTPYIAFT